MHNSQSSDSVPDADVPTTAVQDQDPVMAPTSPPNDHLPSPSPISAQPLQAPQSDQEDPSPTSLHPPTESTADPRPHEPTPDPRSAATPTSTQLPAHPLKEDADPGQPGSSTPPRRNQRQRGRPGRPPNINENSLMRRLECVMAVESGRMTMLSACQQYAISARTFYRWLRNKERLIELTGFTEDDFKNGSPPVSKQTLEMQDSARMPAQRTDGDGNLPRLPNQPVVSAGPDNRPREPSPPLATANQAFAGSKRRLPKSAEPNREFPPQGDERFASPPVPFYRRNFTKMPSQPPFGRDTGSGPSERQTAARNATRMRRDAWHDQPNVEYVRTDERGFPLPYTESPPEAYKRRKVARPQHIPQADDAGEPLMMSPSRDHPADERAIEDSSFVNGNSSNHHEAMERAHLSRDGGPSEAVLHGKTVIVNGARPPREVVLSEAVYDPRAPRKHRIEIMMGRRKVTLAWYDGTAPEDIKTSIARRFALLPETQWALVDHEYDEIVVSDGLPSGRYTLTVLS